MIDHEAVQTALRTRLLALEVASTGVTTLARVSDGYTRPLGSFVADGFAAGMEVVASGFPGAGHRHTIRHVAAGKLTIDTSVSTALSPTSVGDGRRLDVGLPHTRGWTDLPITPDSGRPYVEEDYVFGPASQPGVGPFATVIGEPLWVLRFYVPSRVGSVASTRYVAAMLSHFPPRLSLALAPGGVVRIRTNPAPFAGQLTTRTDAPGWSQIPVTVPLRVSALNTL
jgi:hypothetical protein